MLFFANHPRNALTPKIRECFRGIFEQVHALRRSGRRHGRRQIDEPFRICREPAHHFQRRQSVLLANRHVVVQPGRYDPFSNHVLEIEQIIVLLLRSKLRLRGDRRCHQRPDRLRVSAFRRDRDNLLLRITQRRQSASENTTVIDVDRPVQPV